MECNCASASRDGERGEGRKGREATGACPLSLPLINYSLELNTLNIAPARWCRVAVTFTVLLPKEGSACLFARHAPAAGLSDLTAPGLLNKVNDQGGLVEDRTGGCCHESWEYRNRMAGHIIGGRR